MENEKVIEALKNSPYWSTEYENFNATTDEAKEYLKKLGYVINGYREVGEHYEYLHAGDINIEKIADDIILTGFEKNEPNYKKYKSEWAAKEARPYYTPELGYLIPIEALPEFEAFFKAKKEKYERERKIKIAKQLIEGCGGESWDKTDYHYPATDRIARMEDNIRTLESQYRGIELTPNGRKYKASYDGVKYQTAEEAQAKYNAFIAERRAYLQGELNKLKDEYKEALTTLEEEQKTPTI
jgi:hypothetical protein